MKTLTRILTGPPAEIAEFKKKVSLSTYFPAGTHYFYGYPTGDASGFLNRVSLSAEELVAARAFSCAGPRVKVVSFAATSTPLLNKTVLQALGVPQVRRSQSTLLPATINTQLKGAARNEAIKAALKQCVPPGSLIMAQAYLDDDLANLYQIPAQLSAWVNDKKNMTNYIAEDKMPKRFATYENGAALAKKKKTLTAPCVIKVSSSSAGDGVFICNSDADIYAAAQAVRTVKGSIFVEQLIDVRKNYGIHFGIPHAANKSIDILGINEQITTAEGAFLGGLIQTKNIDADLRATVEYLRKDVLPKIRNMGWYGVGGFDVLRDKHNKFYIIDCNFRMTAMSAYHFLVANDEISTPLLSFGGTIEGAPDMVRKHLLPLVSGSKKFLRIIVLSQQGATWRINGALSFTGQSQLRERIGLLLDAGIVSPALQQTVDRFSPD